MRLLFRLPVWLPVLLMAFSSCKYYRQDIMFRVDDERDKAYIKEKVTDVELNYRIRQNDYLEFQLFTNGGELLIDPNSELNRQLTKMGTGASAMQGGAATGGANVNGERPKYLVSGKGDVLLPMVGNVQVENLTLRQVDSLLSQRFSTFYQNCFVLSRVQNRRCIVFLSGQSAGGGASNIFSQPMAGKVIMLDKEKMNLFEVLALAGTIGTYSQMQRIRIIRGDLRNPDVLIVNVTHVNTIAQQDLTIRPNDIVFVEPGRRPLLDVLRDVSTIGGFITSSAAIVLVYLSLNR